MLTTLIAALVLAAGFALPHGHGAATALARPGHVVAFDTNGGGPPTHP